MKRLTIMLFALTTALATMAKDYTLSSPDGRLAITLSDGITYKVRYDGTTLMDNCLMGLNLQGRSDKGKIAQAKFGITEETVETFLYRQSTYTTRCNTLKLTLKSGLVVEVRAYDEGLAYRFVTNEQSDFTVTDETAEFRFTDNYTAYLPHTTNPTNPMAMAFQATYEAAPLTEGAQSIAFLPATIDCRTCKLTLMEANLEAYPGMFLKKDGQALVGTFAQYPKETAYNAWRHQQYVTATEDYIARCPAKRNLPWRIIAVSNDDRQMPVNHLVYTLADENRIGDTSWIKAGKVAWDWWNDWGLTGVDFQAGINMDTYRKYIDFAAAYGLEYIILDEGWYVPQSGDMLTTIPDIDLPALVAYGKEKKVDIVLWTVFNVLDDQLEEACRKYSAMGIKGFKVDFLDRDDQTAVEMAYRIAEVCARYHMILDYHGIYKPTGINRTYPNVVNFESVFGMEEVKWTAHDAQDMPLYDVTFPYIRMQAGFVDFTPGGMRNATKADFQPVYYNPMTMGTRCHQAAMYVIHDSPFTMLADSPSAYEKEPEYTALLASIPSEWDETVIPLGEMGKYIVSARRNGNDWFIGGQTNWDARDLSLDLHFLGAGTYQATLLTDGRNADKNASDYALKQTQVNSDDTLKIHLASGGGFLIKLTH